MPRHNFPPVPDPLARRSDEIIGDALAILTHRNVTVQEAFDNAALFALGVVHVRQHPPTDDDLRQVRDSASTHMVPK